MFIGNNLVDVISGFNSIFCEGGTLQDRAASFRLDLNTGITRGSDCMTKLSVNPT